MKISIESTTKIVNLEFGHGVTVPARVWEGKTESGTPVHCFITRICPTVPPTDPRCEEFARELKECRAPSVEIQAIPLRMIL